MFSPLNGLLLSFACIGMHSKERRYGLQITFLGSQGSFSSGSGRQGDGNWLQNLEKETYFVPGPLTFKLRTLLAKQVSQDFMHSFSGLIAPFQEPPVPSQGCTPLGHCFRPESGRGSKATKRLGDFLQIE